MIFVGQEDLQLRLILEDEIPADQAYLTLSHCWGQAGAKPPMLTSDNVASLRQSLSAVELTNTFKDAIIATRRMGFSYLWIDSLCINQSDLADWANEAAHMASVYERAALNLIAADATDGSVGMFYTRRISPHSGQYFSVRRSRFLGSRCVLSLDPNGIHRPQHATDLRAWIFQERYLSKRNLSFTKGQLQWDCGELLADETDSLWTNADDKYSISVLKYRLYPEIPLFEALVLWGDIVGIYTHGSLSISTDKLIALSGITSKFTKFFRYDYVAGLWNVDLEVQLLWYNYAPGPRPTAYCAPTWSWASTDGPVHVGRPSSTLPHILHIKTEEVATTLVGQDPFGQISSGFLRVKSRLLIPVRIIDAERLDIVVDSEELSSTEIIFHPDASDFHENGPLYCMSTAEVYFRVEGIVLKPSRDRFFERIGMYSVYFSEAEPSRLVTYSKQAERAVLTQPRDEERCIPAGVDDEGNELIMITII